jgi:hypothetical protein
MNVVALQDVTDATTAAYSIGQRLGDGVEHRLRDQPRRLGLRLDGRQVARRGSYSGAKEKVAEQRNSWKRRAEKKEAKGEQKAARRR